MGSENGHWCTQNTENCYGFDFLELWDVGIYRDNHVRFVAGRRKLFRARRTCWISGGAFCVAGSWLAVGRNRGPEKGSRMFFFWYS
jgi:hypothetical protein